MRRYRIAEDLAEILPDTMCRLRVSLFLDTAQYIEQVRSCEIANLLATDARKHVQLQPPQNSLPAHVSPRLGLLRVPLPRHDLECAGVAINSGGLLGLARRTGVDAVAELLSRPLVSLARFLQLHLGVGSQREQTFLAAVAVLVTPPARSVGIDEQEQPTAIEEFPGFAIDFAVLIAVSVSFMGVSA